MSDSTPVEVTDNLDEFSAAFFGTKPTELTETKEVPETPSATEEPEEAEVEESEAPDEGTGDDAPADDEPEEEEEPVEAPKPKRKSVNERISELTAKARQAERERDALRQELEQAKSGKSETSEPRQATTPLDAAAPTPDDLLEGGVPKYPLGEFDPTFISELTRFIIRQETEAEKVKMQQERQQGEMERAERELLADWSEKLTTAAERLPALPEKVVDLESSFSDLDPNYGKYLASTIMSLEYGPDVLNYLADNPAEARKIVNMGATQATIALGRLEARFVAGEVEREPVVATQAPPPPPRTRGSGGRVGVPADTDDLDAFEKQFFRK